MKRPGDLEILDGPAIDSRQSRIAHRTLVVADIRPVGLRERQRLAHEQEAQREAQPPSVHIPALVIGVTTSLRNDTREWSPWIMIGPGASSSLSSAPPVIAGRTALLCTRWPLSVAVM